MNHFISAQCEGYTCGVCGMPATHKFQEIVFSDDPKRLFAPSAWVCCEHFQMIVGPQIGCLLYRVQDDGIHVFEDPYTHVLAFGTTREAAWTDLLSKLEEHGPLLTDLERRMQRRLSTLNTVLANGGLREQGFSMDHLRDAVEARVTEGKYIKVSARSRPDRVEADNAQERERLRRDQEWKQS